MSTKSGSSGLGLKIGFTIIVVAAAVLLFVFQGRPTARVAVVTKGKAVNAVPGSVTVRAEYEQPLVSEVPGRVIEQDFNLDPGRKVRKGEVLARIDPTDLELDIESI